MREALAARITSGELQPGDRLPAERQLQEDFSCARSVIRQALAALTRDGWIMSAYPRGYVVLGARIPWLSRLRLLSGEPWTVEIVEAVQEVASPSVAEDLLIEAGDPVVARRSLLRGPTTDGTWGKGVSTYPAAALGVPDIDTLLSPSEITYDHLEAIFRRRIIGYHERIAARRPSTEESTALSMAESAPVIEVRRVSRTTTTPISSFSFVGRADRFEAEYLVQA